MKAVIYARFSSLNQHDESIIAQLHSCREYAARQDILIVREYTDEARSATTDNRPGFLQMILDITSGSSGVDAVLVQELNRFSRDRYDFAVYRHKLKQHGIRVISATQSIPDGPEGIILESLIEAMAEHYSANLSKVVKDRQKVYAEKAIHLGGIPPLGYVVQDRKYIIHPQEAETVKTIFEMAAAGEGYGAIIKRANARGMLTKNKKPFGNNSIHEILKNEKYKGVYVFNRASEKSGGKRNNHSSKSEEDIVRIPDALPAIIEVKTWEAVRKSMMDRKQTSPRRHGEMIYILTGKLFCGECGAAITGNSQIAGRNKTKYFIYTCANKKRLKNCDNKNIRKEIIEEYILDEIRALFEPVNEEKLIDSILKLNEESNQDNTGEIAQTKKDLAAISDKMDNLFSGIEEGTLDRKVAGPRLKVLDGEKKGLEIKLAVLEKKKYIPLDQELIRGYIRDNQNILSDYSDLAGCKKLIDTYIEKVILSKNDIEIFYKFTPKPPSVGNKEKIGRGLDSIPPASTIIIRDQKIDRALLYKTKPR